MSGGNKTNNKMKKETNYQVAIEKTIIRVEEGETKDCYIYNEEVLKPKFNKIKMDFVKYLLDLKYSEFVLHLEDYTDIGYDDFDNYDEYACDFIKDIINEYVIKKIKETEYSDEVMEQWNND